MRFSLLASLGLASLASARSSVFSGSTDKYFIVKNAHGPSGPDVSMFSHAATGTQLEYVKNSGICETTPGVNQYSGYLNVGKNMSMWVWFFEARKDAENAPVGIWLNGGPGCSSMVGLFQENGPCHFVGNDTEPTLNSYSWNEYANMLYIDQPVGAGFSYGENKVNSTVTAAPYVWEFMQAFYAHFPQYKSREFGLFTESYGGHYGPEFVNHFLEQNDRIDDGQAMGDKIEVVALGINNGWLDPKRQFRAYAAYAVNNPYKKILTNETVGQFLYWYDELCVPAINNCTDLVGNDEACKKADLVCNQQMYYNLNIASKKDYDVYDVRIGSKVVDPPDQYSDYITRRDVMKKIGARTRFAECDDVVYDSMTATGDDARSFLGRLANVVERNITTIIWAGDADWICNWEGNFDAINALNWSGQDEFAAMEVKPYTVNCASHGTYKTLDNLSWLRVFEAGHEVPYYQPETALQVFKQTMQRKPLKST